ncbi:MAG: hypothetical protein H0V16_07435, partial [Burkholderiaceae bacterium]|nr:hypothetical protein [Burkholderiaceae bacterium]
MNAPADGGDYCTRLVGDLASIGVVSWNRLLEQSSSDNPFLRYEFL